MRAVLDPNVLVSAVISPGGPPANVLRAWLEGRFDLVVSPQLLDELERALGYPKLRKHVRAEQAGALISLLRREAISTDDPSRAPNAQSSDPGDHYLLALAEQERCVLVSGDRDVLAVKGPLPVLSPAEFLRLLRPG
jgi:putative PIN family toxin of toxin-antitoxin system